MLFRRRNELSLSEKIRGLIWPRTSISRSIRYFSKRVLRLTSSPHSVAAGVAAGVFAATTPLLGFHTVIALALAWVLKGNMVAALVGTAFGNPVVLPLVWGMTLETGRLILTGKWSGEGIPDGLGHMLVHLDLKFLWEPILKPMLVGSIPVGVAFALVFYGLTRWGTLVFRRKRLQRLAARAQQRATLDDQAGADR